MRILNDCHKRCSGSYFRHLLRTTQSYLLHLQRKFFPVRKLISSMLTIGIGLAGNPVKNVAADQFNRPSSFEERRKQQIATHAFPTTSIGSFPQTAGDRDTPSLYQVYQHHYSITWKMASSIKLTMGSNSSCKRLQKVLLTSFADFPESDDGMTCRNQEGSPTIQEGHHQRGAVREGNQGIHLLLHQGAGGAGS